MEEQLRDLHNSCQERAISNEHRLTMMDDKLDQLLELVRGDVMHKLDDHEKRIGSIERSRIWFAGWAAGAGAVGVIVTTFLGRVL